jgi:enterochelin esterase-like enzyme
LEREVSIDIYLPPDYRRNKTKQFPILICNDGQDLVQMNMINILKKLYKTRRIPSVIVVGVHANEQRMQEYGTTGILDYKGRGARADIYKSFIINELLAYLMDKFRVSPFVNDAAFCGFSLGGLSAFDIAWGTPQIFGTVGVFSGALWWRSRPVNPRNPDSDRIIHEKVLHSSKNEGQKFWFQTGTLDEEDDRNGNGVIDSIDDTLHLIEILKQKGYTTDEIRYFEIEGGRHDQATWAAAMPDFLIWTFGGENFKMD